MTINEVKEIIERHNNDIDIFMKESLPLLLINMGCDVKKENNEYIFVGLDCWFKANQIIDTMQFYKKAKCILDDLRTKGFDIKINMQSNKLIYYGFIE